MRSGTGRRCGEAFSYENFRNDSSCFHSPRATDEALQSGSVKATLQTRFADEIADALAYNKNESLPHYILKERYISSNPNRALPVSIFWLATEVSPNQIVKTTGDTTGS